jgi:hypothetical protein
MPSKKYALPTLLAIALAYFLLDALNRLLFSSAILTTGGNWIYLPSGLRLAFILIFLNTGALGVVLASCAIGLVHSSGMDPLTVLGSGLITGFSPWLARLICLDKFKLDTELHQLNASALVKMAVIFAALNAVMQQMWLTWREPSTQFVEATAVMFVGDLLGTFVLLYIAKYVISLLPGPKPT